MACWDKDNVEVIPKGTNHTVLLEVHVGLGWFGFLIVQTISVLRVSAVFWYSMRAVASIAAMMTLKRVLTEMLTSAIPRRCSRKWTT